MRPIAVIVALLMCLSCFAAETSKQLTITVGPPANGCVNLSWSFPDGQRPGYSFSVSRSLTPKGPYIPLVQALTSYSYSDCSGLVKGTTYWYMVQGLKPASPGDSWDDHQLGFFHVTF